MPRYTTSDGLSLYFEDDGQGPPVLCLAGLTRNSRDFSFLRPHLQGHRIIAMDYRGRGKSDYAEDFTSYNIVREGTDAIELLDHLRIDKATVIGTSRGGLSTMALSRVHPERLKGAVLNDIGPDVAAEGIARIFEYVGKTPPFGDLEEAAQAVADGHKDAFPDVPFARWREQTEFMWDNAPGGGIAIRYDARLRDALTGQAGAGGAADLWQLFDGLKDMPLAAIRGANSDLLSPETFVKMQDRHPSMIATTVRNRGHVPFLDEPEALAAIHALLEQTK